MDMPSSVDGSALISAQLNKKHMASVLLLLVSVLPLGLFIRFAEARGDAEPPGGGEWRTRVTPQEREITEGQERMKKTQQEVIWHSSCIGKKDKID